MFGHLCRSSYVHNKSDYHICTLSLCYKWFMTLWQFIPEGVMIVYARWPCQVVMIKTIV